MNSFLSKLANIRKDYGSQLPDDEFELGSNPIAQFEQWLKEAIDKKVIEATAMTLTTVNTQGRPSSRPVLLKGVEGDKLIWFTNYHSRKGQELEHNHHAALQFFWPQLERVVRIEGIVNKITEQQSEQYYCSRPLANRLGAWASKQSQPLSSRAVLLKQVAQYGLKFGLTPPKPHFWGGYALSPDYWEFWQGKISRLHDRIIYQLEDGLSWRKQRLYP